MADEEVLFQRGGGGGDRNMWDDSEMIRAWNEQLDRAKQQQAAAVAADMRGLPQQQGDGGSGGEGVVTSESPSGGDVDAPIAPYTASGAAAAATVGMPPMPPNASEELKQLLQAWYSAGYWSAKMEARGALRSSQQ